MKFKMKSVGFKVSLLYIFLAILNMSFFSMMIYENQIDLITKTTKYEAKDITNSIMISLQKFSKEMQDRKILRARSRDEIIKVIKNIVSRKVENFSIFNEDGKTIFQSDPSATVTQSDILNSMRAIANQDFTGKEYFSNIVSIRF